VQGCNVERCGLEEEFAGILRGMKETAGSSGIWLKYLKLEHKWIPLDMVTSNLFCVLQHVAMTPGDWPSKFWNNVLEDVVPDSATAYTAVVIGEEFGRGTASLVRRGVKVVTCVTSRTNVWCGKGAVPLVSTDMSSTFAQSLKKSSSGK
jgi:hypothetical protein